MVAIEYLSALYFFAGGGPQMDGCPTVLLDFEMRFLETIFWMYRFCGCLLLVGSLRFLVPLLSETISLNPQFLQSLNC